MDLKKEMRESAFLKKIYNYFIGKNKFKIQSGNNVQIQGLLSKCEIVVCGRENQIMIESTCRMVNCKIYIYGINNKIYCEKMTNFRDTEFYIEDNNNSILVNSGTFIHGKTHLAATEGTTIQIGDKCMFSNDIVFRTGDSHAIYDNAGKRINEAADIQIGSNVWICNRAMVLKGAQVGSGTVVGAGAIVTKNVSKEENVLLIGSPARVIRKNISWTEER